MRTSKFIQLLLIGLIMVSCSQANLNMYMNNAKNGIESKFFREQYNDQNYVVLEKFKELIEDAGTTLQEINEFLNGLRSLVILYEYEEDMCGLIHYAAANGASEVVSLLLERGVPIDFKSGKGKTSLHFGVEEGCENIVLQLLEIDRSGSLLYAQDNEGNTPLHLAIISRYNRVANFLIEKAEKNGLLLQDKAGYTALHIAVGVGADKIVSRLLEKQPKLSNVQDQKGDTALHIAVVKEHVKIIRKLLKQGNADSKIANNKGFTALDLANNEEEDDDENKDVKEQIIDILINSKEVNKFYND